MKKQSKNRVTENRGDLSDHLQHREMARRLNMVFLLVAAALLQSAAAQTTHVVGDASGWIVPPNADTYSNWAANKTFVVGDILGKNTSKFQFQFSYSIRNSKLLNESER